jgi:hypothetical protein
VRECEHVFGYVRSPTGYTIACQKCGDVYGSSERADPQFLAAFNRREWCFNAARKNASGRHLTAEQKR